MQSLIRVFEWIAFAGFLASLLVHVLSLFGLGSPFGHITWALHGGVFVVWIPAVIVSQRLTKNVNRADMWKAILRGCPSWARTAVTVLFGYTFLNFFLFLLQTTAYPKNNVPEVVEYRGFSGHWMLFYAAAAAIFHSALRLGDTTQPRCPRGHEVPPFAHYCEVCGSQLPPSPVEPS